MTKEQIEIRIQELDATIKNREVFNGWKAREIAPPWDRYNRESQLARRSYEVACRPYEMLLASKKCMQMHEMTHFTEDFRRDQLVYALLGVLEGFNWLNLLPPPPSEIDRWDSLPPGRIGYNAEPCKWAVAILDGAEWPIQVGAVA